MTSCFQSGTRLYAVDPCVTTAESLRSVLVTTRPLARPLRDHELATGIDCDEVYPRLLVGDM